MWKTGCWATIGYILRTKVNILYLTYVGVNLYQIIEVIFNGKINFFQPKKYLSGHFLPFTKTGRKDKGAVADSSQSWIPQKAIDFIDLYGFLRRLTEDWLK